MAKPENIQLAFLELLRQSKNQVTAFTTNGVRMIGEIVAFDSYCVVMDIGSGPQMLYKHALSTLDPKPPFTWSEDASKSAPAKLPNVQSSFLNKIRKEKAIVTVFTTNGVRMTGRLVAFDQFSVIVQVDGVPKLLYKHALSTIAPKLPFSWAADEIEAG